MQRLRRWEIPCHGHDTCHDRVESLECQPAARRRSEQWRYIHSSPVAAGTDGQPESIEQQGIKPYQSMLSLYGNFRIADQKIYVTGA